MADNNLISARDASVINDLGIVAAGLSLFLAVAIVLIVGHRALNHGPIIKSNFGAVPSRILYFALLLSIGNSASFIVTCSSLASDQRSCDAAMWCFLVTLHIMNGLCAAILLHCALLLTCKNLRLSTLLVRLSLALITLGSLALGTAGLIAGRFGFVADQDTCWIIPASNKTSRFAAYKMLAILLYGPLFGVLLLSFIALGSVWYHLSTLRRKVDLDLSKSKALILRISFPPAVMSIHCLLIIGGDLPITYHTRAGQFASYFFNYIGLGSFGLTLAFCAFFIDPALRNILRLHKATTDSRKKSEDGNNDDAEAIQIQVSQKHETMQISHDSLDSLVDAKDISQASSDEVLPSEHCNETKDHDSASRTAESPTTDQNEAVVDPNGRRPSIRTGSVIKWPSDLSRRVSDSHVCTPDGDCCIFIV